MAKINSVKLLAWESVGVLWISVAGWILHFAFELSGYDRRMALIAAVNESAWEHAKLYFWPGLVYALVQYTYTRAVARNYVLGKALSLAVTPITIFIVYFSYLAWIRFNDTEGTLVAMLLIMTFGVAVGQAVSYRVLTMPALGTPFARYGVAIGILTLLCFSSFTYFPPRARLFENFYCYEYTNDFGFLPDYEPYRVFLKKDDPNATPGGGVQYCKAVYERRRAEREAAAAGGQTEP
ncbi:MAG: DUF6512 family protein [Gammaproteobacteria bacterium]|nr:DUF6512 family protein [Gammaproteobacteria bacterium]